MAYATPMIILIFQQLNQMASARRAERTQDKIDSLQVQAEIARREVMKAAEVTAHELQASAERTAVSVAMGKAASDVKLDVIHGLVNSSLAAAKASVLALTEQVARLQEEIEALRKTYGVAGPPPSRSES